MSTPKMPAVQPAPVNPEVDPKSQEAADEASRKAKERQQKGTTATKTILTSGAGVTDDEQTDKKKANLG